MSELLHDPYSILKTLHLLGVVMLIGNVTVTSVWKTFAMRTDEPRIIAFAQRLVTLTDFMLTLPAVILIYGTGVAAARLDGIGLFSQGWLVVGQALFAVSGAIWLLILIPIQIRQAREGRVLVSQERVSASFRRDNAAWLAWGVLATVPLVGAIWVMIVKP